MRTEDLIAELSGKAGGVASGTMTRKAMGALALGLVATVAIFAVLLGCRPGIVEALCTPVTAAKTILPLALGATALGLTLRAARPGAAPGPLGLAIWVLPVVALGLFGWSFATIPAGSRMTVFIGHSIPVCLPAILLLSAPVGILLLRVLRAGAPEHPGRCGALAGLAAAGFATALYSLFCTEDAPLFYVWWYGVGIGIVTLLGTFAGTRFLRW